MTPRARHAGPRIRSGAGFDPASSVRAQGVVMGKRYGRVIGSRRQPPHRLIGDRAYDSDSLDQSPAARGKAFYWGGFTPLPFERRLPQAPLVGFLTSSVGNASVPYSVNLHLPRGGPDVQNPVRPTPGTVRCLPIPGYIPKLIVVKRGIVETGGFLNDASPLVWRNAPKVPESFFAVIDRHYAKRRLSRS